MAKYQSMNDFSNSMVFVFAISILISLLTNTTRVCSSSDENVKVMNLNWFYFNSLLILFSGFIVYLYMSFNSVDYFYELYTIIFFSFFINVSQMIIAKINLELRLFYIFIIEGVSSLLSFILFMVVLFSEYSSSAIFLSKAIYVLLVFLLSIFIIVFYFKFTYKLRGSTYQDFKKYITITCDQVVNMLGGYFDKFIIGFLLGKEFFAIYKLTGDLVLFIFSRISMIISRYLLPLFKSNIKDRFETNKLLIASFKWVSLLGFPITWDSCYSV
ncbi:oligosaccharide flippase family protein [Pseudoalteromonas sp. Hal273]